VEHTPQLNISIFPLSGDFITILLRNFPADTTVDEIRALTSRFGGLREVATIVTDGKVAGIEYRFCIALYLSVRVYTNIVGM